jgi:arylsulfatase A-like enzyme
MEGNNFVYIVLDSCRYDSFAKAHTPNIDRIGQAEQRYSFASWTSPSHFTLLMGQVPHSSPRRVFASEVYKTQFAQWVDRLGIPNLSFKTFVPELCLPAALKKYGYRSIARVSMPVLNPFAGLTRGFDDYSLMPNHNDFAGMVREMEFPADERRFYFLNLGETHYPYMLTDQELPKISGVHGIARGMDALLARSSDMPTEEPEFFPLETMQFLHQQQVRCVEYIDDLVGELFTKCPPHTYFIITADHGELFGEDNYFGHGPVMHEKCFEVPFVEGRLPLDA